MGKVTALRFFIGGILFVFLLTGSYFAVTWMRSDLVLREVRAELDAWQAAGEVSSLDEWQRQLDALGNAEAVHSENPLIHQYRGLLHEWRGFAVAGQDISASDILIARREATAAYREVVQHKAVQASDWASLARMKALSGEVDAEFTHALERAMALGLNIPAVQRSVAFMLSLTWTRIRDDDPIGVQVKEYIQHAFLHSTAVREIVDYLGNAGILEEFCEGLDSDELRSVVRNACGVG